VKRLLSPKDLAAAIGVSESSLKRWADSGKIAVVRTEGGHRRIDIAEAVRFVRESGVQLVRPDVLGLAEVAAVANEDGQGEALYQHLAAGNLPEVRGLVRRHLSPRRARRRACDGPILAAMTRLGELWRHDSQGIFLEHRATDLCVQAVVASCAG
jgi:excisionase family DNA binding protein